MLAPGLLIWITKNILVGSCSGLKPGLEAGDFIIPIASCGRESTVKIYSRESDVQQPNKVLSDSIKAQFLKDNFKIWEGPIVTCQASLAQTVEDVYQWSEEGYYGVEMESSTVFAVPSHFSVPSAAVIYVADNLIENQTHLSDSYREQAEMRRARQSYQIKVALRELSL